MQYRSRSDWWRWIRGSSFGIQLGLGLDVVAVGCGGDEVIAWIIGTAAGQAADIAGAVELAHLGDERLGGAVCDLEQLGEGRGFPGMNQVQQDKVLNYG